MIVRDILENLNNSQRDAVLYNDGPSLVIAGAGSGKTRVLTHKIATLIQSGIPPWNIMALTFTNKAAREMKGRIADLVDTESASRLWMGTFHSIFYRILRAETNVIGFPEGFTIYDSADSKSLIKTICKEMNLDDKIYKVNSVQSRISSAKNDLISPAAYAGNANMQKQDILSKRPLIKEIFLRYVERCRLAAAMDFDDLLFQTNILFRDNPEILANYQDRFRFILVDEYQDTNFSQYLIIKKLAERHHHVCFVGDDSQSIYSFRGANIENILNFKNTYPDGKIFKLEQNYRSTQTIVNAANSLISKNKGQIQKKVFSKNEKGKKIRVLSAYSDLEEGFMVANKINELRLTTFDSLNDFVILYRTNAQSRIFEESLRKRNLPYRVYGGLSFYQRKEIKDVIAYLRLMINTADEEAFKRVVNYPARGIGDTTLQKIIHSASDNGVSLWNVIGDPSGYELQINSGTAKKLEGFRAFIEKNRSLVPEKNVYELTEQHIQTAGILHEIKEDQSPENLSRMENIHELLAGMHDFCESRIEEGNEAISLTDYLSEVSLLTDQDENKNAEGERITMMTIHAAKGLEFKNVFVAGLEEEIFPSSHCIESEKALEEERRLLYVAITRAKNICVLSYAKSRFRNGQNTFTKPSRFFRDLDPDLLDNPTEASQFSSSLNSTFEHESRYSQTKNYKSNQQSYYQPTSSNKVDSSLINPSTGKKLAKISEATSSDQTASATSTSTGNKASGLRVGGIILHEKFGKGEICGIEGVDDNSKIDVEFENSGHKKLLLKFARFTILE